MKAGEDRPHGVAQGTVGPLPAPAGPCRPLLTPRGSFFWNESVSLSKSLGELEA